MFEIDNETAAVDAPSGSPARVLGGAVRAISRKNALPLSLVTRWLDEAQPNARLVYFTGWFAGDGDEAVNARLLAEQTRGIVNLVQGKPRPDGGGRDYVAIRTSRPAGKPLRAPATIHQQAEAMFKKGGR